jgi:hypothetical protein
MIKQLGVLGILGLLLMLGGFAVVASEQPLVAAGLALILLGLAIIVRTLVQNALEMIGVGQLF